MKFQIEHLGAPGGGQSVAILGAGRLLDVALNHADRVFKEISLFDADPSCARTWRRVGFSPVLDAPRSYEVVDLTGSLSMWTAQLNASLKNGERDTACLTTLLRSLIPQKFSLPKRFSSIISINLLSQIPLYWRDRVQACLKKHLALDTDDNGRLPAPLQEGLEVSMRTLQEQHLSLLAQNGAHTVVMITDSSFNYYQSTLAQWQHERALYCPEPLGLEGYQTFASKKWYWDIAPQGVEQPDYGIVHEVHALAFKRMSS